MSKENEGSDEFSYVISAGSDESESKTKLSFLKYKNQINKSFKSPEHLNRLAEHMARRVENALMKTRNERGPAAKQPKPTIAPELSNIGLSTPSELKTAPSDFDHLFHAQNPDNIDNAKLKERKERERKEREALLKIFKKSRQTKDPLIPVQVEDENNSPQVIYVCLSRLIELNQQFQKEQTSLPFLKARMPKVTYFPKYEVPKNQTLIRQIIMPTPVRPSARSSSQTSERLAKPKKESSVKSMPLKKITKSRSGGAVKR